MFGMLNDSCPRETYPEYIEREAEEGRRAEAKQTALRFGTEAELSFILSEREFAEKAGDGDYLSFLDEAMARMIDDAVPHRS